MTMTNSELDDYLKELRKRQYAVDDLARPQTITIQISAQNMKTLAYNKGFQARDFEMLINQCLESALPGTDAYTEPVEILIKRDHI